MGRAKLFLKWAFVFSVLISWSVFVILGSVAGSFAKEFNIPIYIQTSAGIEKAGSDDIIEILFKNNFEIKEKKEIIPIDRCSLRASGGRFAVDGRVLGFGNKLNFYVNSIANGEGNLIEADGKDRFSLSFNIKKIIETNSEKLVLEANGEGKLNREELDFGNIAIEFDKSGNKVDISGSNDVSFSAEGMDVNFVEGCLMEEKVFYLIIDKGRLDEKRNIEEVRVLLDEYPGLIDMYENLRRLYREYWWVGIPGFTIS